MNPSTALARTLVDELVRNGIRDVVLAPGSRSAPLALAALAAAERGELVLHVRIDERSAGFLALGLAKVSGRPTVVVTTSGTATANLHPAVLEADNACIPLVVLTADRPSELRGVGANQTVDQLGLYGRAVRLFHEFSAPEARSGSNAAWRSLVCRAVAAARGLRTSDPGPVHLNVAFREPLVPDSDPSWVESAEGRGDGLPWVQVASPHVSHPMLDDPSPRTLVLVGDGPTSRAVDAVQLAEVCGWPVVSEPSGNARWGLNAMQLGQLLLGDEELRPDRVIVVGHPTLWRTAQSLLRDERVRVEVVAPYARWTDAPGTAQVIHSVVPQPPDVVIDEAWLAAWKAADARAVEAAKPTLAEWTSAGVAAFLHAALPEDALLVAGSSLPARDLAWAAPRDGVTVVANRGAAGIDGTVSTAIGAAIAWQDDGGGPAYALLGDLTFLHDSNGLALGPDEIRPDLTIVVSNNDGGGIFALLEQGSAEHADAFERVFGTPTGTDLGRLCEAHAVPHRRVTSYDELASALAPQSAGIRVVEAVVPRPTRPS